MAASLRDLAIDIINDAKGATDAKSKIYYLEQVKEVVLHRDLSLLPEIMPDIVDFMVERSTPLRSLLIRFCGEAVLRNVTIIPSVLSLFSFLLNENVEALSRHIAMELKSTYDKIVMYIVKLPPKSKFQSDQPDPKPLWRQLKDIVNKLVDVISSKYSESARIQCMKLLEAVILFGLPPPQQEAGKVVDPRLASMKSQQKTGSTTEQSVMDIPLHHPFINRNDVEQDAESLFSKLLLWTNRGGPQGFPFSPQQMSQLGQLVCAIASVRPRVAANAAAAVVFLLQSKTNPCESMTGPAREHFGRAISRLIRSLSAQQDAEGNIPKLKAALAQLQALGFVDNAKALTGASSADSLVGKKREREDGGLPEEEEEAYKESDNSSAMAALKGREDEMKARLAAAAAVVAIAEPLLDASGKTVSQQTETDLCGQLAELTNLNPTNRMVVVATSENSLGGVPTSNNGLSVSGAPSIVSDVFSQVALASLVRILIEYTRTIEDKTEEKMLHLSSKLAIRSVLALMMADLNAYKGNSESGFVSIKLVTNTLNPSALSRISVGLKAPSDVVLSRSLWTCISFVLSAEHLSPSAKISFFLALLNELRRRFVDFEEASNDRQILEQVHRTCCVVILSRLLQSGSLRVTSHQFLEGLNAVPIECLQLLKLLLYTGVKSSAGESSHPRGGEKSPRAEALHLLLLLCNSSTDEVTMTSALNILLWSCVCEDFEIRTRSVTSLISDVVSAAIEAGEEASFSVQEISKFALHAVVSVIGQDVIEQWIGSGSACTTAQAEISADDKAAEDEIELPSETIAQVISGYDNGKSFEGTFVNPPMGSTSKFDDFAKKRMQLLSQLCVTDPTLLGYYVDFYAVCSWKTLNEGKEVEPSDSNWSVLQKLIRSEWTSIVPAISARHLTEKVFESAFSLRLLRSNGISYLEMAELLLQLLHSDFSVPASSKTIAAVKAFNVRNASAMFMPDDAVPEDQRRFEGEMDYRATYVVRLMTPLLGGLPTSELESLLPHILRVYGEDPENLGQVFARIVRCRPPAMTRAALLVALHRIDPEQFGFKQKTPAERQKVVLESIHLCINSEDFKGDVIKEALTKLLEDEIPVQSLVRTVILSYQKHNEIKKFALMEVVPALVKKRTWLTAKKVWDGVAVVMKGLGTHRDSEQAVRCLLGLPGDQLKALLKAVPTLKAAFSKVLKALSVEEKQSVVSGEWAGLEKLMVEDAAKSKILSELENS